MSKKDDFFKQKLTNQKPEDLLKLLIESIEESEKKQDDAESENISSITFSRSATPILKIDLGKSSSDSKLSTIKKKEEQNNGRNSR